MPNPICFKLLWQLARRAFSRALANTGNRIAARMAIMAMTTKSSIRVKPARRLVRSRTGREAAVAEALVILNNCIAISFETDSQLHYTRHWRFINRGEFRGH